MTWTRSTAGTGVVTLLALLLAVAMAAPAMAAGQERRTPGATGQARFEGRTIDLQRGWGDAQTCVVWNADGETDCYRSQSAADAAVRRHDRPEVSTASGTRSMALAGDPRGAGDPGAVQLASTCSDWLYLYEHSGFSGRVLQFRDRSVYQDLANWGFANETSSFRVGSCGVAFRDAGWSLYPGWSGPGATASSMASGWNDRIRYLRISG